MEKLFHLKENHTNVRTELLAGLTTFMTMAYIVALNPNLLTNFKAEGADLWNAVFMATCIASAVGTFTMAFLANKPFVMAPGMGLNSFFAVVVANIAAITGTSYLVSFRAALCIILIEGILFLILSVLNIREKIVHAIPLPIRLGISPAIGLMLLNIGLGSNAGIYSDTGGPYYVMQDFFGAMTPALGREQMGTGYTQMVLSVVTMFVGLFVIIYLNEKGIDTSKILVSGPSAGAHLSSIMCYSKAVQEKYKVDVSNVIGYCGIGGPYSFRKSATKTLKILLGMLFAKGYDRREGEPLALMTKNHIPMLLIQSRHDGLLEFECAEDFADKAEALGNRCVIYEVEDKRNTHSWYTAGYFLFSREEDKTLDRFMSWIENS